MLTVEQIAHREYLKSATWKDIRQQVIKRDNNKCQKCGNNGYDVHHKHYKNWGNESIKDLITLCRTCHEQLHRLKKAIKNTKSIGTRAMYGYLNRNQKEILIKEFYLSNECDLYNEILYNVKNNKIRNKATKILGYNKWYFQTKRLS